MIPSETLATDCIRDLIASHSRQNGREEALIAPDSRPLSYARLGDQIDYVGRALRTLQLARSDRVAVVLPNGPVMASAFLGIAACATCAPMNPSYRPEEIEFYLEDLGATVVVVPAGIDVPARDVANRLGLIVLELDSTADPVAGAFTFRGVTADDDTPVDWGQNEDIALVLHTSGTTSRPKQVPLSHQNLCESARNIADTLNLSPEDVCLNVMPLFHIHGLVGVLLSSMFAGGKVICSKGYDDSSFTELMHNFASTWYSAVPTIHQSVLALARENPAVAEGGHLRFVRSSSAALPPSVMARLEAVFGVPVIESYGMTEAAHQMASNPLPPAARKPGSIGLPAGPEMAIMDDAGNLIPAGENGEIVIRGSNVTAGYANNPEANEAAFTNGWFRTGDLGCTDHDGYFTITGRKKEIVNRGGEKISPREIDEALLEHPAVAQAVAFAVPHCGLGEDIAAAVVLEKEANVSEQDLREFVFTRLADFKVPSQIVFVEAIPKGPTGKLQRIGLHKQLKTRLEVEYLEPDGPIENQLAALWMELLNLPQIGQLSNFFACGGDSLLATRLAARVRVNLDVELNLPALFRQPTLRAQAELIDQLLKAASQANEQEMTAMLDKLDSLSEEEAARLLAEEQGDSLV